MYYFKNKTPYLSAQIFYFPPRWLPPLRIKNRFQLNKFGDRVYEQDSVSADFKKDTCRKIFWYSGIYMYSSRYSFPHRDSGFDIFATMKYVVNKMLAYYFNNQLVSW